MSTAIEIIEEPARAQAILQDARLALLERLHEPASAASLARQLELPRQRVNYHLRELESARLIELVEERRKGNVNERFYVRSARHYAISPAALGPLASHPDAVQDRFSSEYQIATASRVIQELATLRDGAAEAKKRLPTFALQAEVRFASAADRNAFSEDLAHAVADLIRRYHDDKAPKGRPFRFYLGAYPKPKDP